MKSFYSIIRFINNSLSNENISVGMMVVSGENIFYRFSVDKISLVKKINPVNSSLFEYTLEKIKSFLAEEVSSKKPLFSKYTFDVEYLRRLSIYNNGFLRFDAPSAINIDFDKTKFESFFKRYIDLNIEIPATKTIDRSFYKSIKAVFSEPLKDKIDIDYKIKKGSIPNLFFDYQLDGIGMNGVIYTVKAINLNSEPHLDLINKHVAELESLNHRLDLYGKSIKIQEKNEHYLVVDKYIGKKSSYKNLYDSLKSQSSQDFAYKVIGIAELPKVTEKILQKPVKKFSEVIHTP